MTDRLTRIEILVLTLTTLAAASALALGGVRPFGIVLGGGAALLDLILIRLLATEALLRRPAPSRIVPLALAKSLVLLAIPALALLLPRGLVDGLSFAVGVSALPLAVVVEAFLPEPVPAERGEG